MKASPKADPRQETDPKRKTEPVCRQCGRPEAHAVGDELLCAACLHERGSCGAVRDEED